LNFLPVLTLNFLSFFFKKNFELSTGAVLSRLTWRVRALQSTAASSSRVYHVTDYGADPTGGADATAAINSAIADAFRRPSNATMTGGIPDLGGAEIHLDGGSYLLKGPLSLPASGGGNLKVSNDVT
jgi:polygalacturonase